MPRYTATHLFCHKCLLLKTKIAFLLNGLLKIVKKLDNVKILNNTLIFCIFILLLSLKGKYSLIDRLMRF